MKLENVVNLRFWEVSKEQALEFVKDNFACDITDTNKTIKTLENVWHEFRAETRKWAVWANEMLENGYKEDAEFDRQMSRQYSKACDAVFCLKRIIERER
jgi:hypothetical protein